MGKCFHISGYICSSRIDGLYMYKHMCLYMYLYKYIINTIRNHQTFFQSFVPFTFLLTVYEGSSSSISLSSVNVSFFSHCSEYKVVSHCKFNFAFPWWLKMSSAFLCTYLAIISWHTYLFNLRDHIFTWVICLFITDS